MIAYPLVSGLLLVAVYMIYALLFRRLTYYRLNRVLLLAGMALVFFQPLEQGPVNWSLQNTLRSWSLSSSTSACAERTSAASATATARGAPKPQPEASASPATAPHSVARIPPTPHSSTEPAVTFVPTSSAQRPAFYQTATFRAWLGYLYLIGVIGFGLRFLVRLGSVLLHLTRHPGRRVGRYRIVHGSRDCAPFSFFNRIFINPARYDSATYAQILAHEQVHARQWHSIDTLLAELLIVFQWFNPFVWRYRRAVIDNLEFLTDDTLLRAGTDRMRYQLSLLQVAAPVAFPAFVTHYHQSTLKSRISMMNRNRTPLRARWKYLLLLPALLISVFCLNSIVQFFGQDTWSGRLENGVYQLRLLPFHLYQRHLLTGEIPLSEAEIAALWAEPAPTLRIKREAGILQLDGTISADEGAGSYRFFPKPDFVRYVTEDLEMDHHTDRLLLRLFFQDFGPQRVAELRRAGLTGVSDRTIALAMLDGVFPELMSLHSGLEAAGYNYLDERVLLDAYRMGVAQELLNLATGLAQMKIRLFSLPQLLEVCRHGGAEALQRFAYPLTEMTEITFSAEQLLVASRQGIMNDLMNSVMALGDHPQYRFTAEQLLNACRQDIDAPLRTLVKQLTQLEYFDFTTAELLDITRHNLEQPVVDLIRELDAVRYPRFHPRELIEICRQGFAEEVLDIVYQVVEGGYGYVSPAEMLAACRRGERQALLTRISR